MFVSAEDRLNKGPFSLSRPRNRIVREPLTTYGAFRQFIRESPWGRAARRTDLRSVNPGSSLESGIRSGKKMISRAMEARRVRQLAANRNKVVSPDAEPGDKEENEKSMFISAEDRLNKGDISRRGPEKESRVKTFHIPKHTRLKRKIHPTTGEALSYEVEEAEVPERFKTVSLSDWNDKLARKVQNKYLETKVERPSQPVKPTPVKSTYRTPQRKSMFISAEDRLSKGTKKESKKDDEQAPEVENEMRDLVHEDKEDLDKFISGTTQQVASAPRPSPTAQGAPNVYRSIGSKYGAQVSKGYSIESSCGICGVLHKSVSKVCTNCDSAMSNTSWYTDNSHLNY